MDILSGREALEAFEREFTEDLKRDQAEWSPSEYRGHVRLSTHQAAFAERFSTKAPDAWSKLQGMTNIVVRWLNADFSIKRGEGTAENATERAFWARALNMALRSWAKDHGIDVPWIHFISLMTVRAFGYHHAMKHDPPASLLFNVYPFLTLEKGMVELGHATLTERHTSILAVNADQGLLEWDTIAETKAQFKKRALAAYEAALDAQLDAVDDLVTGADIEVHWHWIDWTIERYAGKKSIRSIATSAGTSRPAVSKAIEKTRSELGLEKLPESWGATTTR